MTGHDLRHHESGAGKRKQRLYAHSVPIFDQTDIQHHLWNQLVSNAKVPLYIKTNKKILYKQTVCWFMRTAAQ